MIILFLLISASVAIDNNFNCEKLSSYDCEDVGYCYYDNGNCKKDDCLAVASNNDSTENGCNAECNVATFEDGGFTNYDRCQPSPYLFVCTRRTKNTYSDPESHGISNCFAGMVLSSGVCNKSTDGVVNYCVNVTYSYYANDGSGSQFNGVTCGINSDRICNEIGAENCKMISVCALVGGVCVLDQCILSSGGTSSCSALNDCSNYTVYSYSNSGTSYTISTETQCGRKDKYGSGTTPNQCESLLTTNDYSSEDPCANWNPGSDMPPSSTHCTVSPITDCDITYCTSDCSEAATNKCTSASGIPGVTCSVQTIPQGILPFSLQRTICSDGRTFASADNNTNDGSSAVAVRSCSLLTVLFTAVLLVVFTN